VAFGARRLSIVDVEGGHQPFFSEDGQICGMQNGELYNHDALRTQLKRDGHRFRSRCDTEILPHLYEAEHDRFVERLRGMFGLAIWDARNRRAVLARDRLGVKPLYWAQVDDLVLFASELKSVLASGLVPIELDYDAIEAYLTLGFVPAPHTPLAGVHKLLPGHQLVIENGSVHERSYWRYPQPNPDQPARPLHEYTEELLDLLKESARLRLMSDVPLGAMLSGGLDSSLIVALMAELHTEPVKTFSVGFREDTNNELDDARTIANHYGTDHHELELSFLDDTIDLPDLVWHLDEPLADLSALGFLALSQLARQHVTVALSGQGADELFAGYERYRNAALAGRWRRLPPWGQQAARSLLSVGPRKARRAAEVFAASTPLDLLVALYGRESDEVDAVRRGSRDRVASMLGKRFGQLSTGDPLETTLYLDAQLALPDDMLHYFDRTSMAHSLEVRVPFLDHPLVEWAATVPTALKVRRDVTKFVLKEAARSVVPAAAIDKPKIGFFRQAAAGWLQAQLAVAVDEYLSGPDTLVGAYLDIEAVRADARQNPDRTQLVLAVLMLEIWHRRVLEGASSAVALSGRAG
jgi:asparagine synthase (glutamine-hydrolysing)